jgi:purine-binding chemotaxis protein CheW
LSGNGKIELPASGLAEDVLAGFVAHAQAEADLDAQRATVEERRGTFHLVSFGLAGECYGVPIESVQEIIRATGVTPVPGAPAQVRGVINLRGRIIPVVDLRRRFLLPEQEAHDDQRIMVVELGARRLGMLVDSVSQVLRVPAATVEELPEEAVPVGESYLLGVGKLEDRLVFIIDLERTLLTGR